MAKLSIQAGATSQSVTIFIQDSSSAVGAGLSGLVYNTSGLIGYYTFTGTNAGSVAITLATLSAVNSAYSSGGFKEIHATNMKGLYRFDIPDAALATAKGRSVVIMLSGATNMAPLVLEIELTGVDNQDAAAFGLSRLDAAMTTRMATFTVPSNFASLSIDGSGRVDVIKVNGTSQSARDLGGQLDATISSRMATFTLPTNFSSLSVDGSGRVDVAKMAGGAVVPPNLGMVQAANVVSNGTASAGSSNTITVPAGPSTTNAYVNMPIQIVGGTGAGQVRMIHAYNGSTKVATVVPNWATAPDATSQYIILAGSGTSVWDEVLADHLAAGSTGAALNAAGSAGDPWSTTLPGAYGAGSAGNILGNRLDVAVSTRSTQAQILSDATPFPGARVDAAVSSAATPTQVKAQMVNALNVDNYVQPGQSAPPAIPTIVQMLSFLYKAWRNRVTQTNTQYTLYNDNGFTIDQKATFSDDGTTADRAQIITGP